MNVSKQTNSKRVSALFLIMILVAASIGIAYSLGFITLPSQTPSPSNNPSTAPVATPSSTPSTSKFNPVKKTDLNWGGYLVCSDLLLPQPAVKAISATWLVPQVTPSVSDTFSAVWIGVGGSFDNSLIQIGSEQDSVNGQTYYSAWYEMLPDYSITIDNLQVSPGDKMQASITLIDSNTNQWSLFLQDVTTGKQFQLNVNYNSSQLSAEWIIERPSINSRVSGLASFGNLYFSDCNVVLGSESGGITSFPCIQITMYQNVGFNREVAQLVSVGSPLENGTSFSITHLG